jgi:hypothetical protein
MSLFGGKKMALMIAASAATSAGKAMEFADDDNVGLDDKLGKAFEVAGDATLKYLGGKGDWRSGMKAAGEALVALSEDESII